MEAYIPQLVQAVQTRKSRRKYLDEPLEQSQLSLLTAFFGGLTVPFEHQTEISIHKAPESLGIATCWYGHYKKDNVYQIVYQTKEGNAPKTIHSVTPLGYASEKAAGISDRITHALFSSKKKTVDEKLHKDSITDFPEYIRSALKLSCKAPSAMNSQCWYFKIAKNIESYEVEISKPPGYKHLKWPYPDIDVGTAAAHFWIGLQNQNISCQVVLIEETDRAMWRFIIKYNSENGGKV